MPSENITAYERFLEYGPIGLAGLTLVLSVSAILARDLNDNQFKILRLVLITGFASLVSLLVADFISVDDTHDMRVTIMPLDVQNQIGVFPEPLVKVDEVEIDRKIPHPVSDDFFVTVDVSLAISAVQSAISEANRSVDVLESVSDRLSELEADLEAVKSRSGIEGLRVATSLSQSLQSINLEAAALAKSSQGE